MKKKIIINQIGGDGYTINPNISIGGMPGHSRYSYNLVPVFEGSLLQNGGSKKENKDCDCKKKENTVFDLIKLKGGKNEEKGKPCKCKSKDPTVFDLIQMKGGFAAEAATAGLTQFSAIKEISTLLSPMGSNALISLILLIFMQSFTQKRPQKKIAIQVGGGISEMESILAPLGKSNLIVLASLLLLHYVAKNTLDNDESEEKELKKKTKKPMVGGASSDITGAISSILAPLGVNSLGTSAILIMIQQAFMSSSKKNNKTNSQEKDTIKTKKLIKQQGGSSMLKDLIAPLGTNAFIATGLLILIEKLFVNKERKNNYEKLFNTLAPISFNAFAKKSFLDNMAKKKMEEKEKILKSKSKK